MKGVFAAALGFLLPFAGGLPAAEAEREPCVPSWHQVPAPVGAKVLAVAAAPWGWVAVGEGGVVLASADGERWEVASTLGEVTLRGVGWGRDLLVVVGDGGSIFAGEDPWRLRPVREGSGGRLNAVAFNGSAFVAGGADGATLLSGVLWRSDDGWRWEGVGPAGLLPVYGVSGRGRGFAAVGWNGLWAESPDGWVWTTGSLASLMHQCTFMLRPSFLYSVASLPARTVAVGLVVGDQYPGVGVALAQEDGSPWRCAVTEIPPHPFRFFAVVAGDSVFVAAGLGGVAISEDGLTWRPELELPGVSLWAVAVKGEVWVAAGDHGALWVRGCSPPRRPRRVLRPLR